MSFGQAVLVALAELLVLRLEVLKFHHQQVDFTFVDLHVVFLFGQLVGLSVHTPIQPSNFLPLILVVSLCFLMGLLQLAELGPERRCLIV